MRVDGFAATQQNGGVINLQKLKANYFELRQTRPAHDAVQPNQPQHNMAKSLSSLWLKNVKRMGKAQQAQGRRLFKSLLPKAVRAAPVWRAKPVKTLKLVGRKAVKRSRPPSATPARPLSALPGVWQKSYFSTPGAGQLAPARRMMYWLYLPSSAVGEADASKGLPPLVVMLHGCQQTAADFATATRMNKLAERKGFAVLYPQQSASADAHRCWHWYKRTQQRGFGDVRLIAEMIAQVQYKHGLDASRTYVAGLSAGAALANILALRYPQLIAAVGLHSAPVFGTTDSAMSAYHVMQRGSGPAHNETAHAFAKGQPLLCGKPGMPVILIHGARDPVVRRINVEQLTQQFLIINAASITRAEPVPRSYPARATGRSPRHAYATETYYAGRKPQLLTCEIAVLGHAWSGGDPNVAFSAREGPNATLMMWDFFALHWRNLEPVESLEPINP